MQELTKLKDSALIDPKTRSEYLKLKADIYNAAPVVNQYLSALVRIRDGRLYLHECESWQEWCSKFAGTTAEAVRKFQFRERQRAARKLIAETTNEPLQKERSTGGTALSKPEPKAQENLSEPEPAAPAKTVKPYTEPEPEPPPAKPAAPTRAMSVSPSIFDELRELVSKLERLNKTTALAASDDFRHCVKLARHIADSLQPELPGMPKSSDKPTLEMVKLHAAKIGLPEIEAEKFWHFYNSKGWKVGNQPMKSWHSAMATWKLSQQQRSSYGQPTQNTQRNPPVNPRNAGVIRCGPDYGEAAARKQELQRANAARNATVAG